MNNPVEMTPQTIRNIYWVFSEKLRQKFRASRKQYRIKWRRRLLEVSDNNMDKYADYSNSLSTGAYLFSDPGLNSAVSKLTEIEWDIVRMHAINNRSFAAISQYLLKKYGFRFNGDAIRMKYNRAIRKLRKQMEDYRGENGTSGSSPL